MGYPWEVYQRALERWERLLDEEPTSRDLQTIEEAILQLRPYSPLPLIERWNARLSGPVWAVRAADLDGDGRWEIVAGGDGGRIFHFHPTEEGWERKAVYEAPGGGEARIVGLATRREFLDIGERLVVFSRSASGLQPFELILSDRSGEYTSMELRPFPERKVLLSRGYGDPQTTPPVGEIVPEGKRRYRIRKGELVGAFDAPLSIVAAVHDSEWLYVGYEGNRLARLLHRQGKWIEDETWGKNAKPGGEIRALSLLHCEDDAPLLLVANGAGEIAAFRAESGDPVWRAQTQCDILAMDTHPEAPQIIVGSRDGQVRVYEVVGEAGIARCARFLEEGYRLAVEAVGDEERLLARWLEHEEEELARFAVERLVDRLPDLASWMERLIAGRGGIDLAEPMMLYLVAVLEDRLLKGRISAEWTFDRLQALHERARRPVRRRIDLLWARYTARFRSLDRESFDSLRQRRRRGDLSEARELARTGRETADVEALQEAVALYGECLVAHRQVLWLFAAEGPVVAVQPLPVEPGKSPQAVVATSDGHLALLDLEARRVLHRYRLETKGGIRNVVLGRLETGGRKALAVATGDGRLCLYDLEGDLALSTPTCTVPWEPEVWGENGERVAFGGGNVACWGDGERGGGAPLTGAAVWRLAAVIDDVDGDGCDEVITTDAREAVLEVWTTRGEGARFRVRFPSPVVAAHALHKDGAVLGIAVACADGQICLLDPTGRRVWRYDLEGPVRSLHALDVDGDGATEILVGAEDGFVHVIDGSGRRLWAIAVGVPVHRVAGVRSLAGRLYLLAADAEATVHLLEVIPPGSEREQALKAEAAKCFAALVGEEDPQAVVRRWLERPPNPYLLGYVLGTATTVALPEVVPPLAEMPPAVQEAYLDALVRAVQRAPNDEVLDGLRKRWVDLLRDEGINPYAVATALARIASPDGVDERALTFWLPVLEIAAVHPHPAVRREVIRLLRPFLIAASRLQEEKPMPHSQWSVPDDHPMWSLLYRLLEEKEDGAQGSGWVLEELSTVVRDQFLEDPIAALILSHRLIGQWVNPKWLSTLGNPDLRLLESEEARALFRELGHLAMVQRSSAAEAEGLPAAMNSLVNALDRAVGAGILSDGEPLVKAYRGLAELAALSGVQGLREYFLGSLGKEPPVHALRTACEETGVFRALAEMIRDLEREIVQGLQAFQQSPHKQRLEMLRQLRFDLQAFRGREQDKASRDSLRRLWKQILSGIVQQWEGPDGALGGEIRRLSRTFDYGVDVVDRRVSGTAIQVRFRLTNTGCVPVHSLRLGQPEARWRDRNLRCETEPRFTSPRKRFDPDERMWAVVQIVVDESLLEAWFQETKGITVQLRVPIEYYLESEQEEKIVELEVPLLPETFRQADYATAFPSAWSRYGREIRRLLSHHEDPVLVECERGARRSFLHKIESLVPDLRCRVLDLTEGYWTVVREQKEGKGFAIQPADLQVWLLQSLWKEVDPTLIEELRWRSYRAVMKRAWEQMPPKVRPDVLILDQFDSFLIRLLRRPGGRQVLEEVLPFWMEWARSSGFRLVLGGSFLTEKILEACFPAVHPHLDIVRADYLLVGKGGYEEAVAFVEREIARQKLEGALDHFRPRLTPARIVELCGGNLLLIRTLFLDGLKSLKERLEEGGEEDRREMTKEPEKFFLEYGQEQNFFNSLWIWLPFPEQLALVLLAHSEIALEEKKWLARGLTLSRDYRPGVPSTGRRRARKVIARAGEPLTPQLVQTIRSSKYFGPDDVWVYGFSTKRPSSLERSAETAMLLRLLQGLGGARVLARLTRQEVLTTHRVPQALGRVYDLRVPLMRTWLRTSGVLERMVEAMQGKEGGNWCPESLYLDQRLPEKKTLLFQGRSPQPLYKTLPLEDLPRVSSSLRREDRGLFFNLYGLGKEVSPPQRWTLIVRIAEALKEMRASTRPPAESSAAVFFSSLGELLGQPPIPCPQAEEGEGRPTHLLLGQGEVALQCMNFGKILPGFSPQALVGITRDGGEVAPLARQLKEEAKRLLFPEEATAEAEEEEGEEDWRAVVCIFALRNAEPLREQLERRYGRIRYAVLEWRELAEIMIDSQPARRLLRIGQNHIGRQAFSPYKLRGPLAADSPLFVGREREIERIRDHIHESDFLILGCRRIGKTTLLRRVQVELGRSQRYLPIPLNLSSSVETIETFYDKLRIELREMGLGQYAEILGDGKSPYTDFREMVLAMREREGKHPVFLLDEVDGLYRYDTEHNQRRFFEFLRNALAQASPRLCSFVMTGYQQVYLDAQHHGSVFFNFCDPLNIAEVDPNSAQRLVKLLKEYGVEFYHEKDAVDRILEGTFCVPWAIQTACHELLGVLDEKNDFRVEMEDVERVISWQIDRDLAEELWDSLQVDLSLPDVPPKLAKLRAKILLLAIILEKYSFLDRVNVHRLLPVGQRFFTAAEAVEWLGEWAGELRPYWTWSEEEVSIILRALTITLAVSVDRDGVSYYFPQDILPTILFRRHRTSRRDDLIDRLDDLIKQYREICESQRSL